MFIKYFFPRILESLSPLPRQHSASIGCTINYQPIGVTVHSHCVESFEGLLQQGRGCSELWKNTIFPEHPVDKYANTFKKKSIHHVNSVLLTFLGKGLNQPPTITYLPFTWGSFLKWRIPLRQTGGSRSLSSETGSQRSPSSETGWLLSIFGPVGEYILGVTNKRDVSIYYKRTFHGKYLYQPIWLFP